MWTWRKKAPPPQLEAPQPEQPDIRHELPPFAAMVADMLDLGMSREAIVYAVAQVEIARAVMEEQVRAEMAGVTMVTKPRNHTRRRPKKRKRAQYMQAYRARLRVVTG